MTNHPLWVISATRIDTQRTEPLPGGLTLGTSNAERVIEELRNAGFEIVPKSDTSVDPSTSSKG